jgi:hypothetical protein
MKRALSILLVLFLALSVLPAGAFAAEAKVVMSPQNLRADGKRIACEKYNIDGSNYFKLRDIAMVLSGTGSRFSVNWDGENKCISIVTGEEYAPDGTELDLSFGDKSASAAPGADKLFINGVERSDLSAYKLEGNNFYKLRDLGDALGFQVDYDKESNTAIIISRAYCEPLPWRTEESFITGNNGRNERSVTTYDEFGNILSAFYDYGGYTESYEYSYNELGYETQNTYRYHSEYDGEVWENYHTTTSEYDKWGLLVKKTTVSGGTDMTENGDAEEIYTYDEDGQKIRYESVSPYGVSVYEYTYAYGLLATETFDYEEYHSVTTYTYDERGNLLNCHNDSSDWDTDTTYTYNEEGRELSYVYYDGADLFSTYYTYDALGRLLQEEYDSPDEEYVIEYTYDDQGNILCETCTGSEYNYRTDYTYDLSEGKRIANTVVEYPAATELALSEGELTLAAGDAYSLERFFLPANAPEEYVDWSSSDESVLTVDGEGNLTALAAGTAVVTAETESGLAAACTVTVVKDKYKLTVDSTSLRMKKGETLKLRCCVEIAGPSFDYVYINNQPSADDVLDLEWGDWADDYIDLSITAVGYGSCSVWIWISEEKEGDSIKTFERINVNVTVTG